MRNVLSVIASVDESCEGDVTSTEDPDLDQVRDIPIFSQLIDRIPSSRKTLPCDDIPIFFTTYWQNPLIQENSPL